MKKKLSAFGLRKRSVQWTAMVLLIGALTMGSTAAEENIITLDRAIEIALSKNPDLKQVSNQVQLSEISVKQKKANFYPGVSLSANSAQQYFKALNPQTNGYESETSRTANVKISAAVNLFNGFYDTASLRQSQMELRAAEGNFSRSGQGILFETLQRYIQVVLSSDLIRVEKENLEAQRLQLDLIQDFYNAGKRPVTDLYQQKAEISSSEYQLLDSQRNYRVNKLLLLQTLGLEPHPAYQVAGLEIDRLLKEIKTPAAEDALKEALVKRPDLGARQWQVQAAEKGVKAARAGYWPALSLYTDLGSNYNSLNEYGNLSHQLFDYNLNTTIGLSLSIPIFDKGITKNNVAAAKINVENQHLALASLKNQVAVEVRQAVENYRTAVQQVDTAETQLTYARAALESVEARYSVQAATIAELTLARAQYLQAAYNQVNSKYNLLLQAIATAFYKGNPGEIMALIKK